MTINRGMDKEDVVRTILRDPMDGSLPGSSVQGIFQARVLKWGATAFSVEQQ